MLLLIMVKRSENRNGIRRMEISKCPQFKRRKGTGDLKCTLAKNTGEITRMPLGYLEKINNTIKDQ